MRKATREDRYTLVLEPFWKHRKSRIAIVCPKDLWLFHHLSKLKGVSFDATRGTLTMPNTAIQIRSLQRHMKGYGFWVDSRLGEASSP